MPSTVDFIVSMVLVFAVFAVLVSTLTEIWHTVRNQRARCLWAGVARMLGDDAAGRQIVDDLKRHPALWAMASGDKGLASYLPSQLFAAALVDVLMAMPAQSRSEPHGLGDAIAVVVQESDQAGAVLGFLWRRAGADPALFQQQVATYFDQLMDRVSGWYKRGSARRCFLAGLLCAIAFNIDAVHLARALWNDPHLAQAYAANGERVLLAYSPDGGARPPADPNKVVKAGLAMELPIGWPAKWYQERHGQERGVPLSEYVWAALGFVMMACACLIGAPLWFQVLAALMPLRMAGKVPARAAPPQELPDAVPAPTAPPVGSSSGDEALNYIEHKLVRNGDVEVLQRALGVKETGGFDTATRSAIDRRQSEFGFERTGQVTRMFLKKLGIDDLAAKP
jgi:hypothetical protein